MRIISAIALSLLMVQFHSCIASALDEAYSDEYWANEASNFSSESHYDLALMCIKKSLDINSNNSNAWLIKGKILAQIGYQKGNRENILYYKQSLECYDKGILINPLV